MPASPRHGRRRCAGSIGKQGEQLKRIGRAARLEIGRQWQEPVFLSLWVKVRENWADEPAALTRFGYD